MDRTGAMGMDRTDSCWDVIPSAARNLIAWRWGWVVRFFTPLRSVQNDILGAVQNDKKDFVRSDSIDFFGMTRFIVTMGWC